MSSLMLGTVTAKSGNDLSVTLDGTTTTTPAVDCCGADTASRVVCALHGTQLLAIALVGGQPAPQIAADYVTESGTANGWTYSKWASGRAECWREYDLYVSSWAAWGSVYESAQGVPALTFPSGLFTVAPAPLVSLRGSSNGSFIMGFETDGAASSATSRPLYLMRPTTTPAATFYLYVKFEGRWQ